VHVKTRPKISVNELIRRKHPFDSRAEKELGPGFGYIVPLYARRLADAIDQEILFSLNPKLKNRKN
jgi:hypothetical protein